MSKSNNTEILLYRPNLLKNPTFVDSSFWEGNTNGEWAFTGNEAVYTANGFNDLLSQTVLVGGVTYNMQFTVNNLTTGAIAIVAGTNVYNISSNGTYNFDLMADTTDETLYPASVYSIFPFLLNTGASVSLVSVYQSPTNFSLELFGQIDIPMTFSIADIRNPEKRNASYSKTVSIPGSKYNDKVFSDIFEISGDSTFNPNKKSKCIVLQDGLEIFNGVLQLTNIVRTSVSYNDYDSITYEVNLIGRLADIFLELGDSFLTDLDLSEYNHAWNRTNVENSWVGIVKKNGSPFQNYVSSATESITSIQMDPDTGTGTRVRLNFSNAHAYTLADELSVSLANVSTSQLNGYHTIHRLSSSTSIVLNYGWDSLISPQSYLSSTGVCAKTTTKANGYVYPLIDYSGDFTPSVGKFVKDFFPAIYMKTYIDKIFAKAGFIYSSIFFNSDYFKRLIVPYANIIDPLPLTLTDINARKFKAIQDNASDQTGSFFTQFHPCTQDDYGNCASNDAFNEAGTSGSITVHCNNDSTNGGYDGSNVYNTTNYRFTAPVTGTYDLMWSGFLDFYVSSSLIVDGEDYSIYPNPNPSNSNPVDAIIVMFWNVTTNTLIGSSNLGIVTNTLYNTSVPAPAQFTHTAAPLNTGDKVEVRIKFSTPPIQWRNDINGAPGNTLQNTVVYWTYDITNSVFWNGLASDIQLTEGYTMDITNTIPKNIKIKDFMVDIIRMFNLYIEPDKDNDKKLIIEPRPDFYSTTSIVDWTQKLDTNSKLNVKPMGDLQGKNYTYSYKPDEDYLNKDHQTDWDHTYGWKREVIDNDFINTTVETKLNVFSPTPIAGPPQFYEGTYNIPLITKLSGTTTFAKTNTNPRILYYGSRGVPKQSNWKFSEASGAFTHETLIPYAGHLDNTFGPKYDLNFSYPDEIYFAGTAWTDNNLYNAYYKDFLFEITNKNSKIVSGMFRLKPYDIAKLDFRNLWYVDGHYLRLNKISDYNVANDGLTLCEFLKVESGVQPRFSATGLTGYTVGTPLTAIGLGGTTLLAGPVLGGVNISSVEATTRILGINNVVEGGTRSLTITGDDNRVGKSQGITIVGSRNYVAEGLRNVAIINTDDVVATRSNESWVNGIHFTEFGIDSGNIDLIDAGRSMILSPFNYASVINVLDAGMDDILGLGSEALINYIEGNPE